MLKRGCCLRRLSGAAFSQIKMTGYADRQRHGLDRQAYTADLELQLQRASNALNVANTRGERTEMLQAQLNTIEDKVINITRLCKLQQSCSEAQEQEIIKLANEISALTQVKPPHDDSLVSRRLEFLENKMRAYEEASLGQMRTDLKARFPSDTEADFDNTEPRFDSKLEQAAFDNKQKLHLLHAQFTASLDRCHQDYNALDRRLSELELRSGGQRQSMDSLKMSRDTLDFNCITELRDLQERAWNSEIACKRLADNSLTRISACERMLRDLEIVVKDALRVRETSSTAEELGVLDKKLSQKLNEACDRLGAVAKAKSFADRECSVEGEGLEMATISLEHSPEVRRAGPISQQTMSFASSPTFEAAQIGQTEESTEQRGQAHEPQPSAKGRSFSDNPSKYSRESHTHQSQLYYANPEHVDNKRLNRNRPVLLHTVETGLQDTFERNADIRLRPEEVWESPQFLSTNPPIRVSSKPISPAVTISKQSQATSRSPSRRSLSPLSRSITDDTSSKPSSRLLKVDLPKPTTKLSLKKSRPRRTSHSKKSQSLTNRTLSPTRAIHSRHKGTEEKLKKPEKKPSKTGKTGKAKGESAKKG